MNDDAGMSKAIENNGCSVRITGKPGDIWNETPQLEDEMLKWQKINSTLGKM